MEHYNPSPEISHNADPDPFESYSKNVTQIEVTVMKSKRSIITEGMKNLGPDRSIVIFAEGSCISKAVSCCEALKSNLNRTTFQNTQLRGMKTTELWLPLIADSGLDPLRVTRSVPIIYILLSLDPILDTWSGLGFQKDRKDAGRRKLTISESEIRDAPLTSPITLPSKSNIRHEVRNGGRRTMTISESEISKTPPSTSAISSISQPKTRHEDRNDAGLRKQRISESGICKTPPSTSPINLCPKEI